MELQQWLSSNITGLQELNNRQNIIIWATAWQHQQNDMRPTNTQISLGIRPVRSESSLCALWVAKDPTFLPADS